MLRFFCPCSGTVLGTILGKDDDGVWAIFPGPADLDVARIGASEGLQPEFLLRVPLVLAERALPPD